MRASALVLLLTACGAERLPEKPTGQDPNPVATGDDAECEFVDLPFSPDAEIVQGVSDDGDACAVLEREAAAQRRGTIWQASRLFIDVGGRIVEARDDVGLSYENTHHNCRDVARLAIDGVEASLTIDGASADPSACFDPSPAAWVLRLEVDGTEWLLHPR